MKKEWQGLFLIFMVAFNLRLGISSVSPLISIIKQELMISNFQASLLTSVPVICMGVFAFFITKFELTFGRKLSISILLVLLGSGTLVRGLFQQYAALLLTAFLIGFSVAIIGPLLSGFIKQEFPAKAGLLIGIYSLGMGLGSVSVSGSTLLLTERFHGDWSKALAVWGGISLVSAAVWFFLSPADAKQAGSKKQSQETTKLPLMNQTAWKMVAFFAIQSGMFYSLVTWIAEYFRHKEVSESYSVFLLTFFTAVQMIFSFIIPAFMDRFQHIPFWVISCSGCVLLGVLIIAVSKAPVMSLTGVALLAIGNGGFFPIALLLPLRQIKTPLEVSLWTAMMQAFGYMIGGIIPILIGILIDRTGDLNCLLFWLTLGSLLLMGLSLSFSRTEKSIELVEYNE